MTAPVGLVIVSHSRTLAEGVVELAGQMAPGVPIVAAGGMPDGRLGTDFAAVGEAVTRADGGAGVVLLYDLGSAQMTADMVVETLDDPSTAVVAQAPLVEGAIAAAVAAAGGANLAAVAAAAEGGEAPDAQPRASGQSARAEVTLANDVGLHARPAALLARSLAGLSADVTVRFGDQRADGHSVLALLGLAARKGDTLVVDATGEQAEEAVTRISKLVADDFAE